MGDQAGPDETTDRAVLVLRETDIRELLDPSACIQAVERAFSAYSGGQAELPAVIHLDVPEQRGEIHIKAGHLHHGPYYAVKMVSGFPGNPGLGRPANDGMVVVFEARTGAPAAFLLDNGFITDLRTGAAGAVAAKYLAPEKISTIAILGTGGQARHQVEMLARVRRFQEVRIWGRDAGKAWACAEELSRRPGISACNFAVADTAREAVAPADLVITVTASRTPLLQADWLRSNATVIAVGSDGPDKQELDVAVLGRADKIVADSIAQCLRIGEIHHAVAQGAIPQDKVVELGEIIAGRKLGRTSKEEFIVCDLTGVGVQDVAAASLVMERALASQRGERIEI
ncbi:MAG: ornithine cyclodeaminase family protein [Acidobacteria bacterium]|nr:ornithine cyclodeaminase family protein [Acidobacteriota bacterium]